MKTGVTKYTVYLSTFFQNVKCYKNELSKGEMYMCNENKYASMISSLNYVYYSNIIKPPPIIHGIVLAATEFYLYS